MQWQTLSADETLEKIETSRHGLSKAEALHRLERFGPNALPEKKPDTILVIFLRQFKSPIIYILLIAALIVLFMGEHVDAAVIFAVLLINAIIGAFQEGKAQNTLRALRSFVTTEATVVREGSELVIKDVGVVPGDIVFLKEGDKVPADGRIIEAQLFRLDEAAMTGESEPVEKHADSIANPELPIADQRNMVFRGTYVIGGMARVAVTATGLETHIGRISKELTAIDAEMPLKASIRALSRFIIITVLSIALLIFFLGVLRGIEAREMFATVVAIAVSAIPEGLPVVVTLILAAGVYRMSKRNALVRRLQAVEALGQASIIALDKTGTITLNQMMVEYLYTEESLFRATGEGYDPHGVITLDGETIELTHHETILLAGKIAAFTANAAVAYSEEKKSWQRVYGDPTEAALLVFSQKIGFHREDLVRENPTVTEAPFDSVTRYHAVINLVSGKPFLSVTGAPEVIFPLASKVRTKMGVMFLRGPLLAHFEATLHELSARGLRVLALAYDESPPHELDPENLPKLTLLGLVAIRDSIRPEAREAVANAERAGVKVVMITGDHVDTARAVAEDVGIWKKGDRVFLGEDIAKMSPRVLSVSIGDATVFARVAPEHKLRIIEGYRSRKEVVAMTGDGVNDALSLAAADLGVAMGGIGTEVAKEAGDIVLLDDNFNSIIAAIEEGRNIYATIKKVVLYLFSTSLGEILTITAALLLALPLPVSSSQIIWLNFVTDGFLVVALALEPKEALGDGTRVPASKKIIDKTLSVRMILLGVTMMVGTVTVFTFALPQGTAKAMTLALTVLAVFQWFNAWNSRTDTLSLKNPHAANRSLLIATVIVVILQILAVYTPALQSVLRTVPLTLFDWVLVVVVASSIVVVDAFWKIVHARRTERAAFH